MNSLAADPITQNGFFHSTRWTLVLAAGGAEASPSQSLEALSELCEERCPGNGPQVEASSLAGSVIAPFQPVRHRSRDWHSDESH